MSCARPSMGTLQKRSAKLVEASIAANSNATYSNAIESFEKFRLLYNLPCIWPAPKDHVILFIAYCFECGYAPSSITTYIAGLSFKHKLNEWYDPMEMFMIKKLLEGCKRSRVRHDIRSPVTPNMLRAICDRLPHVCYDSYEVLMFRSVYLLAYYGLMRVSELVNTSKLQISRHIQLGDLTFGSDGVMIVTIRESKTCQRGQPVHLKIPCIIDAEVCPVCMLRKYVDMRSKQPGSLFVHANNKPLTRSQFAGVLAKTLQQTPYRSEHVRTHSFRIGRASELASKGVDIEVIKKMGRWKSDAYKTYIR